MLSGALTEDLLFKVAEEGDVTQHLLRCRGRTVWLDGRLHGGLTLLVVPVSKSGQSTGWLSLTG